MRISKTTEVEVPLSLSPSLSLQIRQYGTEPPTLHIWQDTSFVVLTWSDIEQIYLAVKQEMSR